MDSMTYHYIAGTNQLDYISDPVNKNNYKEDIDNQSVHNYTYDSIGNLTKDNAEKISSIEWTVYGKISRILKTDTTEISYIYDAAGQRIAKAVKKNNITDSTYYVRDASGNVMSVYEKNDTIQNGHVIQKELHLYGSSRLGMLIVDIDMDSIVPLTATAYFMRGKKRYELTDHRGNVMVVISDVKKPIRSTIDTNLVIGYEPVVISATDYYPFGMQMPGRHGFATETGAWHGSYAFSIPPYLLVNHRAGNTPLEYVASQTIELSNGFLTGAGSDNYVAYIADSASMATIDSAYQLVGSGYRYGFNGQEHSTELNNDDYTAQFWEYDGRTGRRWNIEPEIKKYADLSSYLAFRNNPILYSDPDGKDVIVLTWATKKGDVGHTMIAVQNYQMVKGKLTPMNSYNLFEIGPANTLFPSQIATPVTADPREYRGITKEQLLANKGPDGKSISHWDKNAPDGALLFKSGAKNDIKATAKMEDKNESNTLYYKAVGGDGKYTDNCTSYVIEIIPKEKIETINATELVEAGGKKIFSQNPTQLFKSASKLKGAIILRDIPKDLKDKSFTQAYYSSTPQVGKSNEAQKKF